MTIRKDVYVGPWTNRKTEKFRQIQPALLALWNVTPRSMPIDPIQNTHHERAHIVGLPAGTIGRMVSWIETDTHNRVTNWVIAHEKSRLSPIRGKDMTRTSLAPLFVRKWRHKTAPSDNDVFYAGVGILLSAIESIRSIYKRTYTRL
jgi:hypothetical protein